MKALYVALGAVAVVAISCQKSGSSGGGGDSTEPAGGVAVFSSQAEILLVTGGSSLDVTEISATAGTALLGRDSATGSVFLVAPDGTVSAFTSGDELKALTGESDVDLGPLDQVLSGTLAGQILTADEVSGLLIRMDVDGTARIHSSEAQITALTGESSAAIHLPRFFAANQILVQDLVSGSLLLIGNAGDPIGGVLVEVTDLATAAGLPEDQATVTQWVQGGSSGAQFGRFVDRNHVIRLDTSGNITRYVDGDDIEAALSVVASPRLLELVADPFSDGLILRIGDGARGVAVVIVDPSGVPSVFSDEDALEAALGAAYDLTGIGVLADGTVYAVDAGNSQVALFEAGGTPVVLATGQDVRDGVGTDVPALSVSTNLQSAAVIVYEQTTGSFLRVD